LATVSAPEPRVEAALRASYEALRDLAGSRLDPAIDTKMLELGERKEFLTEAEHKELMALVNFAQQRSNEKLRAELALKRIEAIYPEWATGR
jgi:hypothetical protein